MFNFKRVLLGAAVILLVGGLPVNAATTGSAQEILSGLGGEGTVHVINNLCQNSDYKLSEDTVTSIKAKLGAGKVEEGDDPIQDLSETDSTTSYLVSNNVLSRLESFSYKNGKINFKTEPLVLESDTNYTSKVFRKSDLYMALYKAVYGVVESRPIVWDNGDEWVYVSPNVYENYLAKLLDKGLIDEDDLVSGNGHTFLSDYKKLSKGDERPAWYSSGKVAYAGETSGALGKSFSYDDSCTVKHKTFNYFKDEEIDVMEALSIVEDFMRLTEKNMTKTEANIITYKYGASALSGLAEQDKDTVSFLVAKGVLNFEDEDFPNYYETLDSDTAYGLVYRFGNKDARFDFSKVSLTDEESFWANKGFSQNNISVTRTTTVPTVETVEAGVTYDNIVESNDSGDVEEDDDSSDGWVTVGRVMNLLGISKVALGLKSNTYSKYKVVKLFDNKLDYTYGGVNLAQLTENSSDVKKIEKDNDYTKITFVVKARSSEDAINAVDGKISCELSTEATSIPCYTSAEDSNGNVVNMISQKTLQDEFPEISVIHDKLLENVNTGTEALIMGESGYAIVGTKVVVSDELMIHDTGDDVYYNLELVTSLLTNAYLKQLDKKIGNQITSLYISDSSLKETRYKVYSDSTMVNKTDVIQLKVKNSDGKKKSTKFFNIDTMSRGLNTASRTFSIKDSQGRDATVTVIVDLDYVVPSSTAFQDGKLSSSILNGPITANNAASVFYTRPTDSESDLQNWWDSNIGCANALYNFLYDTNGIVYVESGWLAPNLTILRSSDAITDAQVESVFKDFKLYDIDGISYKKFFGSDLSSWWDFYYDTNTNTGLCNTSKTLAKQYRKFTQIVGENSTSGTNYKGEFFITKANTIYRTLSEDDDFVSRSLEVNHDQKRIDLVAQTEKENGTQIQVGDTLEYQYLDGNNQKKTTKWIYKGVQGGYYVLIPDIDLMKQNGGAWKTDSVTLQTAGGSSYTLQGLTTDSNLQMYLKQFYKAGFPDLWESIDVTEYTSKTKSSKLFSISAKQFGSSLLGDSDQRYYLSGGKVWTRKIVSKNGKKINSMEVVSNPSSSLSVAAVPVAYIPTGDITITSSDSGNKVTFVATAGYKSGVLHMGNVYLKNINQSVVDYTVYKDMTAKKINELNDGDTLYVGTTLFQKKGDYFVSSPITNSTLVTAAKGAGSASIKSQAVGIFIGQKIRVDGTSRNLSEYVVDADTGTLYNAGNGEDGVVYKEGGTIKVWKDGTTQGDDVAAKQICIKVKFDDNLLVRALSADGNSYVLIYANTYLGTESLGNLPFLSEKLDYNRFSNVDATLGTSKFNVSPFAEVAKTQWLKRFQEQFNTDLGRLVLKFVFWLSALETILLWMCFGVLHYGIGKHWVVLIADPLRTSRRKGIDLVKVLTLKQWDVDSDPSFAQLFVISVFYTALVLGCYALLGG